MAQKQATPKQKQLSIEEYLKIKEKVAGKKLKLQFPLFIKILLILPVIYIVVSVLIFVLNIRHLSEH